MGSASRFVPSRLVAVRVRVRRAGANDGRTFGRIQCGLIYLEASRTRIHQPHAVRRRGAACVERVGAEKGATLRLSLYFALAVISHRPLGTRFHDEWLSVRQTSISVLHMAS